MISCKEAVGLNNKIGTCWNVVIQTNMFYGHNSEIVQKKLNENSVDELLNQTVIENLERFLPPFVLDDRGKIPERTFQLLKKIVINLKKRFDIKNKQKVTKMENTEEDVCERDFVYYVMELIHPGKRNKEDIDTWAGTHTDSFFLTNILDIILLNKLTHIVNYETHIFSGNRISLNIDKIKNIQLYVYQSLGLDITDLTLQTNRFNHVCQFFECEGTTKYSNNNIIIEHDWRMFFKILNMLSVTDYDSQKNESGFTVFSEYDTKPTPLLEYQVCENVSIGPYIITYDSHSKPSIMYSFSPFFKVEKITNHTSILATSVLKEFNFSYNIECTPENIKKLSGLNVGHYLLLDTMTHNIVMIKRLLDRIDVNIIDKDKQTIIMKGIRYQYTMFVIEALKKINKSTLNYQNKGGLTALQIALSYRNKHIIKEIMKYSPDLTLKDNRGFDVTHYTEKFKIDLNDLTTRIFEMIKDTLKDPGPHDLDDLKFFFDRLLDINEVDFSGSTILIHIVKFSDDIKLLEEFLKKNPDLSIQNSDGKTALDIAKMLNKTDMIELLDNYKSKPVHVTPVSVKPPLLKPISSFNTRVRPVNVNVRPVNVKPKGKNENCDIVDTLTVVKLNEVFKEIGKPIPALKILKAERLKILKDLLGC